MPLSENGRTAKYLVEFDCRRRRRGSFLLNRLNHHKTSFCSVTCRSEWLFRCGGICFSRRSYLAYRKPCRNRQSIGEAANGIAAKSQHLSACQLGITLASLALGWIGEPAIARLLEGPLSGLSDTLRHGIAFAVAFSIITSLHIVLGEQAPKLMGLAAAEKVALAIALPLQLFYRVFSLPIRALDWASVRTVQLLGVKATAEHASTYTEEELRKLVDISRESGHLRAEERRLIHRVFEFSDTLVREAMVPRTEMAAIPDTCNLEEITKAFDQHRYSRLPVYHESFDDVCGFIHSKDVMPYLLHPEKFRLKDVLQPPLYVVDTARLERSSPDAESKNAFRICRRRTRRTRRRHHARRSA